MNHVILTRYNNGIYDLPNAEKWMEERRELFMHTRESVYAQEVPFNWFVYFDERTPLSTINDLCEFPWMFPFKDDARNYRPNGWTITTRLDNDDIYLPNALAEIQTAASMFKGQEMVIDIGYEKEKDGKLFPSNRDRANSPFLSLVSNRKNCYCRPHTFMPDDFPSYKVDQVLARMVIHGGNAANTVDS